MARSKHILFPFDFSDRCYLAVPFVASAGNRIGAKITAINVVPFGCPGMEEVAAVHKEEVNLKLKAKLDSLLIKEFQHVRIDAVVEFGDPTQAIINFAHFSDADFVMMPIHSFDSLWRFLGGTVASNVLREVNCPVWTSVHRDEPYSRNHVVCRKILCALSGTPKDISLIDWGVRLAKDMGARLRLVHVNPDMKDWPAGRFDQSCEDGMNEAKQTIERLMKAEGIKSSLCVATGDAGECVCEEARRYNADLVVIGRGMIQGNVGRQAFRIIQQSPCPVLSV
jgi:nucleotide-binding universal stress UspA family protein